LSPRTKPKILVGCAGWSLTAEAKGLIPGEGTHLQRYAAVFSTTEINSSFYRPHRPETYRRWADSVPTDFRFTAKIPKEVTHILRLRAAEKPLERFLEEVGNLGTKLGALLVQLPPSLTLSLREAEAFLGAFRERFYGVIAWEARHASWFTDEARGLLKAHGIGVVAADPVIADDAPGPRTYYRLHGSPRVYYSAYTTEYLEALLPRLRESRGETYVIFDNTASGAAVPNALELMRMLVARPGKASNPS
jgi:uncharacterized protein YecE (DUF72 family)